MKGTDRTIFFIILFVAFVTGLFIFSSDYENYSDLIIFLSIMIGFKMASLSVIFNSSLKRTLFDRKIRYYKTELHRLRDYYKFSLIFEVVSLLYIFIIPNTVLFISFKSIDLSLDKSIMIMPILIGTTFCFYKTFNDLLKIFSHPTNN